MRPTTVTVAGASASNWIPLDHHLHPFAVGFGVVVAGSGAPTYTVQHTFNDVLGGSAATAFDHSDVSGKTTNIDGNYAFPVAAVRLNVTVAGSGSPTATMTVYQAGN